MRGIEIGKRNYKLFKEKKEVPRLRGELTVLQRTRMEYELNHPEKVQKSKPKKEGLLKGRWLCLMQNLTLILYLKRKDNLWILCFDVNF